MNTTAPRWLPASRLLRSETTVIVAIVAMALLMWSIGLRQLDHGFGLWQTAPAAGAASDPIGDILHPPVPHPLRHERTAP